MIGPQWIGTAWSGRWSPAVCFAFRILINYRPASRSRARLARPRLSARTLITRRNGGCDHNAVSSSPPIIGRTIVDRGIRISSATSREYHRDIDFPRHPWNQAGKKRFQPPDGRNINASSRGACKWLGLAPRLIELINRFRLKRECGQSSQYTLTRFENEAFRLSMFKEVRWSCWTYCISTQIFKLA